MRRHEFSKAQQYSSEEVKDITGREKKIVQEAGSDPPTREDHIAAMELAKDEFLGRKRSDKEKDVERRRMYEGRITVHPPTSVIGWTIDFYSTDPVERERFQRAAKEVLRPYRGLARFTERTNSEFCSWEILGMEEASSSRVLKELKMR